MTFNPNEFCDILKTRNEQREEYRREIERHVEPLINAAHDSDKAAIELGQSILKTQTLLNKITTSGPAALAPPCKDGAQTCEPWERQ
jgi:hypothetical protein